FKASFLPLSTLSWKSTSIAELILENENILQNQQPRQKESSSSNTCLLKSLLILKKTRARCVENFQ
ncbi:hypothetical protein MAR_005790, partial [Mya arenaria]